MSHLCPPDGLAVPGFVLAARGALWASVCALRQRRLFQVRGCLLPGTPTRVSVAVLWGQDLHDPFG